VLASRVRAEEKWLLEALERRGRSFEVIDTRSVAFPLDADRPAYSGALVREISHHRALYAARILEHSGLTVVNGAEPITTCGDKVLTTIALRAAGVPTPRCMVALTPEAAREALDEFGYPAVVKPLIGSWGRLVARLADDAAAEAVLELRAALPGAHQHITYVQEYIDKPGRDIRGLIAGTEVIGAIYRVSTRWRTNVARNTRTLPCPLTDELAELLRSAAAAIGPGVYGIDVLEDRDGALYVNEVNHTPEFRGAAGVLPVDIAERYIDFVLNVVDRTGVGAGAGAGD
jgi:[lysine-biosynthesis-protein LysW]--L-2-aminoadipate ligase